MNFVTKANVEKIVKKIRQELENYLTYHSNIQNLVIGMSGGLDSAVTAALAKSVCNKMNICLFGYILPIEQKANEIHLGLLAADKFCDYYFQKDLTNLYNEVVKDFSNTLYFENNLCSRIKAKLEGNNAKYGIMNGNLKARLRMLFLYDQAQLHNGIVLSTDNYSEYLQGFWTLHGDVGDYGMIQNLFKGLEIPIIAEYLKVPKKIINAIPTDGLGISNSDFDQLKVSSYKELDEFLIKLINNEDITYSEIGKQVYERYSNTNFKRNNPKNISRKDLGLL